MTFTERLTVIAQAYADVLHLPLKTVSSRVFNESKLLDLFVAGETSVTLARADRAIQWFSDHWPEGTPWPQGLDRPAPKTFVPPVFITQDGTTIKRAPGAAA